MIEDFMTRTNYDKKQLWNSQILNSAAGQMRQCANNKASTKPPLKCVILEQLIAEVNEIKEVYGNKSVSRELKLIKEVKNGNIDAAAQLQCLRQ